MGLAVSTRRDPIACSRNRSTLVPDVALVASHDLSLLGWTYTVAWSLSFYPQLILNYQRKSSTGLSSDFVAINPTGHGALLIVNVALYSSAVVRGQYEARHGGHPPQVRLNDVWFSSHATLLATLILLQSFYYKVRVFRCLPSHMCSRDTFRLQRDPSQRVSSFNRVFLVCVTAASILLALIAASPSFPRFEYLDVIQFLSYVKLYISFSKYVPQVKLNFVRKSTVGWSIENIILGQSVAHDTIAVCVLTTSPPSTKRLDWRDSVLVRCHFLA